MKKIRWKPLGKALIFLVILGLLFGICQSLFLEKNSYGKYRAWKDLDHVDILILGNSHADNGLRAKTMSEELGQTAGSDITVFNYSVFGMRMEQMYFFAKEILKDHTPDLILLETYAFCPLADEHREILARRAFDVFPLSWNKVEAIRYCVQEDRASYYVPLIKYHTRWKELTEQDFRILYDETLWPEYGGNGMYGIQVCPDPEDGWFEQEPPQEPRELTPSEKECLEKFLDLLEEKDIPLLFVSLPYRVQMGLDSVEQIKINNYLSQNYVNGDSVQMLDMNRLWDELEFGYADLFDEGHANVSGADKLTARLLEYLEAHYDIAGMAGGGR